MTKQHPHSEALAPNRQQKGRTTLRSLTPLSEFVRGVDENNLAEFPLALLSDTAPANVKTLEFQDTMTDWKTGQKITRRVCITGSDKFGLPTAKDDQILAALLQLTEISNNFTNPEVRFTKHQIVELLAWGNCGWAYDRVEESLHRWKGVSLHYWSAWRDHADQSWTDTEAVGVIDYFKISDGRKRQEAAKQTEQSRFTWNREFFKSFRAGYLKPLDFGLYRSLKRPAAKRAFRFLDKRFHHRPDWEFDLHTFACEKLGFSRNYDTGQLKARLQPALVELERAGFIKPVSYRKLRPKTWSVLVSRKLKEVPPTTNEAAPPKLILEQLLAKGVAKSAAQDIVAKYPASCIEEKIRYLNWLIARKDKRTPIHTAGFLVTAIRENYAVPKDYLKSCLQSSRTKLVAADAKQVLAPLAVPDTTDDLLAKLTLQQRVELEAAAVAAADSTTAQGYYRSKANGGLAFAAYQRMLIDRYIAKTPGAFKADPENRDQFGDPLNNQREQ